MASAATMATRVRVNDDCDDILKTPFFARPFDGGLMHLPNQGACQSRKSATNWPTKGSMGDFPNQQLVGIPTARLGTFATLGASNRQRSSRE
jgi:hypothetical protein